MWELKSQVIGIKWGFAGWYFNVFRLLNFTGSGISPKTRYKLISRLLEPRFVLEKDVWNFEIYSLAIHITSLNDLFFGKVIHCSPLRLWVGVESFFSLDLRLDFVLFVHEPLSFDFFIFYGFSLYIMESLIDD